MKKSIFLGAAFIFVALIGLSSANSIGTGTKTTLTGEKSNAITSESRNTTNSNATTHSSASTLNPFIPRR
ncbi:hypothetical protein [Myroides odoratus]|uniref:Uncharacterized protein n=1 Tax=Myroides odoratus TaxID=256 RepID=A0A9Q6ZE58_MYROD|nr:hypothetical protein [Myroides odoratus]EHQ43724.1 hypothetical protein Myrod_2904 [Myroides odoratus DSM 2801]EKB04281.1 hypothetical protein HMPREF9716_03193 [Myroides odoratus CIP 103059]QQU01041.1 hypothetical protein I6I88_04605 [Myroides odoratus]WQD56707.1 hypothetical protein U0010_14425 [Myroides odoratus]STZ31001.1 Uncharacterised protein [Myroides odoratus]